MPAAWVAHPKPKNGKDRLSCLVTPTGNLHNIGTVPTSVLQVVGQLQGRVRLAPVGSGSTADFFLKLKTGDAPRRLGVPGSPLRRQAVRNFQFIFPLFYRT